MLFRSLAQPAQVNLNSQSSIFEKLPVEPYVVDFSLSSIMAEALLKHKSLPIDELIEIARRARPKITEVELGDRDICELLRSRTDIFVVDADNVSLVSTDFMTASDILL